MEVLILIPKETYNTCNFPRGGVGSGSPDPHLSMDSEIKRIGRNDRYSLIYGCSIAADITNSVHVLLWTKFKYYKGQ